MSLILLVATFDLALYIIKNNFQQDFMLFSVDALGELFGIFLVILIGVELLQAVKAFLEEEIVHVEIVVLVAIIAIARKVIVWEFKELRPGNFCPIGHDAGFAISCFLIKHTDHKCRISLKERKEGIRAEVVNCLNPLAVGKFYCLLEIFWFTNVNHKVAGSIVPVN